MMTPDENDQLQPESIGLGSGRIPKKDDNIRVHIHPRISANKLAEFMVASSVRQRAIVKDSKFAKKALVVPYTKARKAIADSFRLSNLDSDFLLNAADQLDIARWGNDWQKNDNKRSASALRNICEISGLSWNDARIVHPPPTGWGHILMSGVRVSINPEIVFSFTHRNIQKVGAILINTAINPSKALSRSKGESPRVGDFLASLIFQMLTNRCESVGAPLHQKCFAVDVFRKELFLAPSSYRALNREMEAACQFIAGLWPNISI